MMETQGPVRLKLDEENSLTFEMTIEGEAPASPVYRLVCETGDVGFTFHGIPGPEGVTFVVPALQHRLKEGVYDAHLEVIIENKLMIPIEFQAEFQVATRVTVESVRVSKKPTKERAPVTAAAKLIKVETAKRSTPRPAPKPSARVAPAAPKKQLTLKELYRLKGRGK